MEFLVLNNYKFCVNHDGNSDSFRLSIPIFLTDINSMNIRYKNVISFLQAHKSSLFPQDTSELTLEVTNSCMMRFGLVPQAYFALEGSLFTELARIARKNEFASLLVSLTFDEFKGGKLSPGLPMIRFNGGFDVFTDSPPVGSIFDTEEPVQFKKNRIGWYLNRHTACYEGRLTMSVKIDGVPSNFWIPEAHTSNDGVSEHSFLKSHSMLTSQLLKNQINTDVTLVLTSGREIKCHKLILAGCSSIFSAMLAAKGSRRGTIQLQLETQTDTEIVGLLAFLYGDTDQFMVSINNFEHSFGILIAATKYEIKPLKNILMQHFMSKTRDWFSDKGLLRVFAHCCMDPDLETLKNYVVIPIKSCYQTILQMDWYREWHAQNPSYIAMELHSSAMHR